MREGITMSSKNIIFAETKFTLKAKYKKHPQKHCEEVTTDPLPVKNPKNKKVPSEIRNKQKQVFPRLDNPNIPKQLKKKLTRKQ